MPPLKPSKDGDGMPREFSVPVILPVHVIARQIGSFLDRRTLNCLRLTSREICQLMNNMETPWPHTKLQVGSKVLGAQSLAFSPDGRSLACRSRGGTLQIWDQRRGKQAEWSSRAPFCFGNLTFSPDGKYLACDGNAKTIRMYEVSTGAVFGIFRGHQGSITSITFSSTDHSLLASGSTDSTVRLWDVSTQKEQAVLQGNSGAIYSIAISQDGQLLATGGVDRILRIWSLEKVKANNPHNFCQNLEGHEMTIVEVAFIAGQLLVSASLDRTIRIWSMNRLLARGDRRKRRIAPLSFTCQRILLLGIEALTLGFSHGSGSFMAVGLSNETVAVWKMQDILSAADDSDGDDEGHTSPRATLDLPVAVFPGKHFCLAQGIMAITLGKDVQLLADDFSSVSYRRVVPES
jgi:WD40 repeat protein